ncbi:Adenosine deaminase 2 [Lamellibrachia satsuma]|nr:Adenosine deaminase 2 [Lamellibrachia satsuma]
MTTGGDVVLNVDELKVNSILMKWKATELSEAMKPNGFFLPAHNFMTVKSKIDESDVFRFIKKMPKGAVLHIHDVSMASSDWLIKNVTYRPDCYMCIDKTGQLLFQLAKSKPIDSKCQWNTVGYYRSQLGNTSLFDSYLFGNMTIITGNPAKAYRTQYEVWQQFNSGFKAIEGLVFTTEIFGAYFEQALKEQLADNVQYVETRALLGPVFDLNGVEKSKDWAVAKYQEVQRKFSKEHPDFFGAKTIFIASRSSNLEAITTDVKEAIRLQQKFPNSLHGIKLPYFFHAGETDWEDTSVDENILDALLLNTSRIGHGYAVMKHPRIRKLLRDNRVAIEVNPISNQVLKLVDDLRNHPAASLMAEGYPVVISSDNPAMWGSTGISYDFYEAFMGLGGAWANLATLKKLAMDSLRYSALGEDEKLAAYKLWQVKWDTFIQGMLHKYQL